MTERIKKQEKQAAGGNGAGSIFDATPEPANKNVSISSGPYAEDLPVAGMSVGEIKRKFADRFDIDPAAQSILNGNAVGDDIILKAGEALMFVRHAGEKGAKVFIEGDRASVMDNGNGAAMTVDNLVQRMSPGLSTGTSIVPAGIRSIMSQGNVTLWFWEKAPSIQKFKWITADSPEPYGPEAEYRDVRIALPYLIIMAMFARGADGIPNLVQTDECFFRTAPLKSMDDELLYPGLLNCSKWNQPSDNNPLSWICTQHLKKTKQMASNDSGQRFMGGFEAVRYCLLETGFNLSSENHEGNSWYGASKQGIPQINPVEQWEENTRKDPMFVLDLPWIKTGLSVRQLAERTFKRCGAADNSIKTADDVARIIING